MRIVFRGSEADRHQVDLSEGAETLAAFGRIGNLVSHYVATRSVRFRGPYDDSIQYVLVRTEAGSFGAVIQGFTRLGADARAAARLDEAGKLFARIVKRGTGRTEEGDLQIDGDVIPAGDIDVLTEASEPALRRSHSWIKQNGRTVTLEPDGSAPVQLNVETKAYLDDEIVAEQREDIDVSVAAINVNARSGRVYLPDLGRTVPFRVPADATPRTLPNLSRYVVKYADRRRDRANFQINAHIIYKKISFTDGRLKRVLIYDCEPLDELI